MIRSYREIRLNNCKGLGRKLQSPLHISLIRPVAEPCLFGYLISAKRAYTDRAIASETGTGFVYGLGARFPLSGKGDRGSFFHASYKFKTQTLTEQDGVNISEAITQTDGYPVFGFGISF